MTARWYGSLRYAPSHTETGRERRSYANRVRVAAYFSSVKRVNTQPIRAYFVFHLRLRPTELYMLLGIAC